MFKESRAERTHSGPPQGKEPARVSFQVLRPFSSHVLTRPLGQSDLSSHSDGGPTSELRNPERGNKRDRQTNRQMRGDRLRKTATKTDEETGKRTENTVVSSNGRR